MVADGKHIASFIANPEGLKQDNIGEIDELLSKFPYASSLYMLQLKALANSNSLLFEEKLKIAAAHVNDRAHLYELIQKEHETEIHESIEEEQSEPDSGDIEIATDLEVSDEVASVEAHTDEVALTSESESEIEESVTEEAEEADELTAQIMSEAISTAFEHSTEELIESTEFKEKEKKEAIQTTEQLSDVVSEESANIDIEKEAEEIHVEEEEQNPNREVSFIEWLKLKKGGSSTSNNSNISEVEEQEQEELKIDPEEKKPSSKMSKREINALLDRFIAEQPSMKKPSKDFFKPSDYAKESIEESNENVTETLAQIHVMQGNYQKAITAYKQLSLLYPEKKAFFASQIKELEDKIS